MGILSEILMTSIDIMCALLFITIDLNVVHKFF